MQILKEPEQRTFTIMDESFESTEHEGYDFRERMITNNSIEGLLRFEINITDHEKRYQYDISELESLKFRCSREKMNTGKLSELLLNLFRIVFKGREFMLLEEDFVLNPEYVFLDREGRPQVAYFSGYGKALKEQLSELTDYLMNNVDYHDENAVLMIYTLYMKCREETFSLEDMIAYTREKSKSGPEKRTPGPPVIRKISGLGVDFRENRQSDGRDEIIEKSDNRKAAELEEIKAADKPKNTAGLMEMAGKTLKAGNSPQRIKALAALVLPIGAAVAAALSGLTLKTDGSRDILKMASFILMGLGVAVLLERKIWQPLKDRIRRLPQNSGEIAAADEATVLLFDKNDSSSNMGCSFVSDYYPTISMNHFPFFIGKDPSHMDYCPDAAGISRRHLKVDRIGLEYTVLDLNSTNGSYINGEKLAPNVDYKIHRGDKITLGNCDYYMN